MFGRVKHGIHIYHVLTLRGMFQQLLARGLKTVKASHSCSTFSGEKSNLSAFSHSSHLGPAQVADVLAKVDAGQDVSAAEQARLDAVKARVRKRKGANAGKAVASAGKALLGPKRWREWCFKGFLAVRFVL